MERSPPSESLVHEVDARLQAAYPPTDLGNKSDPLDELIYILISGKTSERTYQRTFDRLKARFPQWGAVLDSDDAELLAILEPAGLAHKKARWLRSVLEAIQRDFGSLTLEPLRKMTDEEAEAWLTSLPGVGIKTARCVLLYSLRRPTLPVDAHTARLFARLGWSLHHRITDRVQSRMQDAVPPSLRYSLHVNFVLHGREICTSRQPKCTACVLLDLCPTGKQRISQPEVLPSPSA